MRSWHLYGEFFALDDKCMPFTRLKKKRNIKIWFEDTRCERSIVGVRLRVG